MTFVSKYLNLKILKTPSESVITSTGRSRVVKPARWIQFVGGFYETNDPIEVEILEKHRECKRLEDADRLLIDDKVTNVVIDPEYAVPWKKAVGLLGGDQKVLKRLVSLGKVEAIKTDKGVRYKVDDIQKFLAESTT